VNESDAQFPLIIAVIVGGLATSWLLRKVRPGMAPMRRLILVVVGAVLIGGVIYGAIFGRS
jgi:hypothetical protein